MGVGMCQRTEASYDSHINELKWMNMNVESHIIFYIILDSASIDSIQPLTHYLVLGKFLIFSYVNVNSAHYL